MRTVQKWRQRGFHEGATTFIISPTFLHRLKPSTAAAIAGALESAIYGRLSETPAVYIRLNMELGRNRMERSRMRCYYVSHRRAAGLLVQSLDIGLLKGPASRVSHEEGTEIWDLARRKSRDQAP